LNRTIFMFLILAVSLLGCSQNEQIEMPTRGICAHRGDMTTSPENTIAGFKEAIRLGVHMIEFDVYRTKDQKLVVIHDRRVDRTTNGTGKVSDLTFVEIKLLDAGSWHSPDFKGEKVPTFDETLAIIPKNIWLNIHLKDSPETGVEIAQKLKAAGRLHQAFLACDLETKVVAQSVVPELLVCNMERQAEDSLYVAQTISNKADFIQLRKTPIESLEPLVKDLNQNQVNINYFGTDDPEKITALLNSGIGFVLVNNPGPAMQVAAEMGIKPVTVVK
jgi:glycerophosphoryl diester phosphodiesterase